MYTPYESSTVKRFFKYLFGIAIILRILSGFVIWYLYLRSTGAQESKKWWTFVEGIFGQISYLPYLKNDPQSVFYQSFLFRSCLNPYEKDEEGNLKSDLCKVYTENNKNYVLKIIDEEATWSDGTQVTIDDIFFTYDEIIRQNKWGINSLNAWNGITVALENGKIKVEFPTESKSNILFFTNAILPKYVLQQSSLEEYRTDFSLAPVINGCATIMPQNKDLNSLIFNVTNCTNTNFAYYQIKNYESFDKFVENKGKEIVDIYESLYELKGYTNKNILTSNLVWIFFNTNSEKLKVRLRRALGGLIHAQFYTGNYQDFIQKYEGEFLNEYYSNGENIQEFINRMSLTETGINTIDLQDSGAKELPATISVNGVDRKFVFFIEKPKEARNLEIKFSNEFTGIEIKAPDGSVFSPKGYKSEDKKVIYKLSPDGNLKIGSNQYTVNGTIKGKTYTIASIDIYVFEQYTKVSEENNWKINVLYYGDSISTFIVQQLKKIFQNANILNNFIFEEVFTPEELEGKLLMGTYDMYIGSINLGVKSDILTIFGTDESLINPSKYRNPLLTSYIKTYQKEGNEKVKEQINILLAQDMPLVLLWNTYNSVKVKDKIAEKIFSWTNVLNEDTWRYEIYHNYSLINNVRIDWKNAFKWENFSNYLSGEMQDLRELRNKRKEKNADPFSWLVLGTWEIATPSVTIKETSEETTGQNTEENIDEDTEEPSQPVKTLDELVTQN